MLGGTMPGLRRTDGKIGYYAYRASGVACLSLKEILWLGEEIYS